MLHPIRLKRLPSKKELLPLCISNFHVLLKLYINSLSYKMRILAFLENKFNLFELLVSTNPVMTMSIRKGKY